MTKCINCVRLTLCQANMTTAQQQEENECSTFVVTPFSVKDAASVVLLITPHGETHDEVRYTIDKWLEKMPKPAPKSEPKQEPKVNPLQFQNDLLTRKNEALVASRTALTEQLMTTIDVNMQVIDENNSMQDRLARLSQKRDKWKSRAINIAGHHDELVERCQELEQANEVLAKDLTENKACLLKEREASRHLRYDRGNVQEPVPCTTPNREAELQIQNEILRESLYQRSRRELVTGILCGAAGISILVYLPTLFF